MAENCRNWTAHKNLEVFFHSCHSVNEKILQKEHFCGCSLSKSVQKLHKHPRDMPAARWTTTVNKAIEHFTINYFKRINTSQVFNCITEIFQNLRVNTQYIALCWKIQNYACQIKYLLHVSIQNLTFSNSSKIQNIKISVRETPVRKLQTKHKWLMLQHWNRAREDAGSETC